MKNKFLAFCAIIIFFLSACSNNSIQTYEKNRYENKEINKFEHFLSKDEDPWEPLNKRIYHFNYQMDKFIVMPIVKTYKAVTPVFFQDRVTNFFRNIKGINTTVNSLLQFKGRKAMRAVARFLINTVFGLGGTFDVASSLGMPKPYEDFGLTLAAYGVPRGPYIILPFLGPSYLRDAFGMGVETLTIRTSDPYRHMELFEVNSLPVTAIMGIDKRKNVKFEYYGTSSPFEYEYMRFLWSRYRKLQEETGVQFF